jgi:hypothetical protein
LAPISVPVAIQRARAPARSVFCFGRIEFFNGRNLSRVHQLKRQGAVRFRERHQMLLYTQTWLPLVTITLTAAIFFAIASFMLARAKP